MKFQGKPNERAMVIMPKAGEPRVVKFDALGVYETHVRSMANRLKKKYSVIEDTPKHELKKCKKCDYVCEKQGDLLAHYRTEHPKIKDS